VKFEDRYDERKCHLEVCHCTHTAPCFAGWIDSDIEEHATYRCPVCLESLNQHRMFKGKDPILATAPPDSVYRQMPDNDWRDVDPDLRAHVVAGMRSLFGRPM
jgi:hypothetical protein